MASMMSDQFKFKSNLYLFTNATVLSSATAGVEGASRGEAGVLSSPGCSTGITEWGPWILPLLSNTDCSVL